MRGMVAMCLGILFIGATVLGCAGSSDNGDGAGGNGANAEAGGASSTAATSGGSAAGGTLATAVGGSSSGGATTTTSAAPTWSQLYSKYLANGTIGHCSDCHSQAASASAAYSFLRSAGQINGISSPLTVQGSSMLVWFGGTMPQGGKTSDASAQALAEFRAWVAAGALNN